MRRKRRLYVWVTVGFLILYLVIMGACTFLIRAKYMEEFAQDFQTQLSGVVDFIEQMEGEKEDFTGASRQTAYQSLTSSALFNTRFQQYALVFYDKEEGVSARSEYASAIRNSKNYSWMGAENVYSLPDYLSEEEIDQLAHFYLERRNALGAHDPEKYWFYGKIAKDGSLKGLLVQHVIWEQGLKLDDGAVDPFTGGKRERSYTDDKNRTTSYVQTGSEIVWEWNAAEEADEVEALVTEELSLVFPGLLQGYSAWMRWRGSAWLQTAVPEDLESYYASFSQKVRPGSERFQTRYKEDYTVQIGERTCDLTLISECRPWAAAMDYMKYVYLAGFFLMLTCAGTVIMVISGQEAQRAQMEENQRDFINAMAHEMKTPLGIIRGFSENLLEDTVAEKREYYLQQIIGQTEEMDGMVADIIGAARLESQHLVLQKERISVSGLLRGQLAKREPLIKEKQITVQFSAQGEFELEGDRKYLEKAFGNLIGNAVSYCDVGGVIKITTDAVSCRIENDCAGLRAEDVQHAFDIFYRGQCEKASEKHLGIGLYLARRILDLHDIQITAECVPGGFCAVCRKKNNRKSRGRT